MNTKNLCGKIRQKTNPYEIWRSPDGWEWRVLRKYQTPEKEASNPFARWFCSVTTPDNPHGDMGDVYIKEIKRQASKVPDTIEGADADAAEQQRRDEKHGAYGGREDVAN